MSEVQETLVPTIREVATTEVSTFPKKEPDKYCNGKLHRQDGYCTRPAGWGTPHPGTGRCKLHGGCSTGPKSGELRYSDVVPTQVLQRYEEFALEEDVDIKSLDNEIAMTRVKVLAFETRSKELSEKLATETDPFRQSQMKLELNAIERHFLNLTEMIRRLVDTKQRVEEGIKSKVTVEIAVKILDVIIGIIDDNIADKDLKTKICGAIRRSSISGLVQ